MRRVLFLFLCVLIFPLLSATGWLQLEAAGANVPLVLYIAITQLVGLLVFGVVFEIISPANLERGANQEEMRELIASREQFHALYENSPIPYITISERGTIEMYNLAAVRLFETTKDELIGRQFMPFLTAPEEDSSKLDIIKGRLNNQTTVSEEEVLLRTTKDTTKWVELSVFVSEKTKQRLVSLIDVTEKKKVDIAKTEFVALATHQLRTPIAAIRWNMELLEKHIRGCLNVKSEDYLQKVQRNITRMITLINDFLSVSKLETGTFAAAPERIVMKDYLASIEEEFAQHIREKQLTLETTASPEDLAFETDSRLFHIITSNLLSNAVKYTEAGDTISWGYKVDRGNLIFSVTDEGIGIPLSEQPDLFNKFYRASNAMLHQSEGTGLGLYVLKQAAEQLGGSITFSSTEGEGTTFEVTLPLQPQPSKRL